MLTSSVPLSRRKLNFIPQGCGWRCQCVWQYLHTLISPIHIKTKTERWIHPAAAASAYRFKTGQIAIWISSYIITFSLCLRNSEAAWTVYFYFPVSHGHPDVAGSTACYVHCRWRTVALQLDPFLYIERWKGLNNRRECCRPAENLRLETAEMVFANLLHFPQKIMNYI